MWLLVLFRVFGHLLFVLGLLAFVSRRSWLTLGHALVLGRRREAQADVVDWLDLFKFGGRRRRRQLEGLRLGVARESLWRLRNGSRLHVLILAVVEHRDVLKVIQAHVVAKDIVIILWL